MLVDGEDAGEGVVEYGVGDARGVNAGAEGDVVAVGDDG